MSSKPDYRELPEEFLEKMKGLLGDAYGAYLDSFSEEPCYGLRVNTLKLDPHCFAGMAEGVGLALTPVPWIPNGFYYDKEARPARHPWYFAGLYYLQEPSAMTPASLLPVEPGDRVLDLCAAPGGKSTELAARLKGRGLLFSNDISNSRAKALLKNLELFGAENICVSSETPEKLAGRLEGFFDKILVDAPCSGEGMFRRDGDMVKSYSQKGPEYYAPLQREIVSQAVRMLAPGGLLLYSTCTFDREEDEGTIEWALDRFPEMHLIDLEKREGFEPGIGLPQCVRLFPHRVKGEGHFIALLQKDGRTLHDGRFVPENQASQKMQTPENAQASQKTQAPQRAGGRKMPLPGADSVLEFLARTRRSWDESRIFIFGDQAYYLPEALCGAGEGLLKGIRYLRTGLLLGEVKKGRFEPSQALAMCLTAEEYDTKLKLSSSDERAIRYLKGETLSLEPEELSRLQGQKGWCLVCVDGFPLGWGRLQNQNLKNKYYPGWRWQ